VIEIGAHIVPLMPPDMVVEVAKEAERIGYDYCLIADEGFHPDVHACLGAIARETDRIRIGAVTNGYTRHPAVTAAALATVNEMSGGRAFVTLLAGGSMVLAPMGISREKPFRTVSDSMEIMQSLWSGEEITWEGSRFSLDHAALGMGPQSIPIWVASRGPMLLRHAGRHAAGALITVKPDLGAAFGIVDDAAAEADRPRPKHIYLGRICYTPEMLTEQRMTLPYVLMDSPTRVLESLGFDRSEIALVARAAAENAPQLLEPLATLDLLARYQVSGSPAECSTQLHELVDRHRLDAFFGDVLLDNLQDNVTLMEETYAIVAAAGSGGFD